MESKGGRSTADVASSSRRPWQACTALAIKGSSGETADSLSMNVATAVRARNVVETSDAGSVRIGRVQENRCSTSATPCASDAGTGTVPEKDMRERSTQNGGAA